VLLVATVGRVAAVMDVHTNPQKKRQPLSHARERSNVTPTDQKIHVIAARVVGWLVIG